MTTTDWLALLEAIRALPERSRRDVEILHAQAHAYVWGWQDAGGPHPALQTPDSLADSVAFAVAYGWHAYHATTKQTHRRSIPSAYQHWQRTGEIDPLTNNAPVRRPAHRSIPASDAPDGVDGQNREAPPTSRRPAPVPIEHDPSEVTGSGERHPSDVDLLPARPGAADADGPWCRFCQRSTGPAAQRIGAAKPGTNPWCCQDCWDVRLR